MAKHVQGSAIANATSYKLYEKVGTDYIEKAVQNTGGDIDFDLSVILFEAGTHELAVKALADGYLDSAYSNLVSYIVEAEIPDTPDTPDTPVESGWVLYDEGFEIGSTADDTSGTMGNKTNNTKRLRTATAIKPSGGEVKLVAPADAYVWYNLFDDEGKLVGTSTSSRKFPATGEIIIDLSTTAGATQIWPIFKTDSAGAEITQEFIDSVSVYYFVMETGIEIDWENGSFDDSTGEKVDSSARLRTPNKIAVPATATGIKFIPSGTFDLWIKTYDTADQPLPTTNGIKGSAYWNTTYKGVTTLTWAQICSNNKRPNYLNFVLKSKASNLLPIDARKVCIDFTYD